MHYTRIHVLTTLTTQDLGNIFKTSTKSGWGVSSRLRRAGHGSDALGFYKPLSDELVSTDDDPATLQLGVHIPTLSRANGGGVTLHMYVWDRGSHRQVQLLTPPGKIGGVTKSRRCLRRVVDAIRKHDPAAAIAAR
jgi:hypothetical protein